MAEWRRTVDIIKPPNMIKLSKSSISNAEKSRVLSILDDEYLGMGSEVREFEAALAEFFGRPCVCVTNGTIALQLALEACGITTGDEVLVQSLTYVASFQAISATGARPIPCEINSKNMTLDLRDAERRLTLDTKAIMPVHYAGCPGALNEIHSFAKMNGLRVIEDAAHAFGSLYNCNKIGSFGDIACFSFDGIKNITSGEGGCIVTSDEDVLRYTKDARLLGVLHDTDKRYASERSWSFDVVHQGWRGHMSNIMAAIGIAQLDRFHEFSQKRKNLVKCYIDNLSGFSRVKLISHNHDEIVPHIFAVRIEGLTEREKLQEALLNAGIQTGVHYFPNHLLSFYKENTKQPLPVTEKVYPELLTLPLHFDLSECEVTYVCQVLKRLLK